VADFFAKAQIQVDGEKKKQSTAMKILDSIQTTPVEKNDNSQEKLQKILSKFRAGKKLTPEELEYLRQYAPEMYQKVIKIQQQREEVEQQLQAAQTKEQVQQIVSQVTTMIAGAAKGDEFTKEAMSSQLTEALSQGMQDKAYTEDAAPKLCGKTATYATDGNEKIEENLQKRNGKKIDMVV